MDNQGFLKSILTIYKLSGPGNNWSDFWKKWFAKRLPNQEESIDQFILSNCETITHSLTILGKNDPTVKEFLSILPLRYSKTILVWPPTTEQIKDLLTE